MRYDALIIGGGHNGLTCACYLAAAGLSVRVLERRHIVGGTAVTEEFHPGYRNSVASYTVSLLQPKIVKDLKLASHGLEILERPYANFLPLSDGRAFRLGPDTATTQRELARFSKPDALRLPEYYRVIETVADVLREMVLKTPPNLGGGLKDLMSALDAGLRLRKLDMNARRDLLDLFTKSAGELLDHWFESDPVKAAFGFDAVVGNFASPYTPGSAYVLMHHAFGEVNGKRGTWGHARGGMGAITQAMAAEARKRGVEISTECTVKNIRVKNGRAASVTLDSGEEIEAKIFAANVNPRTLYLDLLESGVIDEEIRARMRRYRTGSASFRMNVALSELPDFSSIPGIIAQPHHGAGIIMAPSLAYMDRAHADARTQGWSKEPIVEMLIPSTLDDSLAPPNKHVASLFCQHFNPHLPDGKSWMDHREEAADLIIDTVTRYAPNFKSSVLGRQILSPQDLENIFGLPNGDIMHGSLGLDQIFSARPLLGLADYRTPVKGLYLCGSGAHPGGGVTGAPGHNAAREMLRDWRAMRFS
ncbi:MAG: phytoene desaturase family protein [Burkholderiales bacterium]